MQAAIGTAGWSIARGEAAAFPAEGTALERYAQVFDATEVNSSFHRPHRTSTWAKWAASVPDGFRFAVKIPKTITHQARLVEVEALTARFAQEIAPLGAKLALLLVQLPPKLRFDAGIAERFFTHLRQSIDAEIVCEPRHASWFEDEADDRLKRMRVARVAADPALATVAAVPGGWEGVAYWRLHGSPAMYRSSYSDDAIEGYARQIREAVDKQRDAWCMFDNTAASAATRNALGLMRRLGEPRRTAASRRASSPGGVER
jgi:uncharacterized protein YecE (DUF72 family)